MPRFARLVALVILALAAPRYAPARTHAEAPRTDAPRTLAALRAQLSALRTQQPAAAESVQLSIAHLLDVAERIDTKFPKQAAEWRARADRYLALAKEGKDPYLEERGRIVSRGYRTPISTRIQGYTVYVPPDYTPDKKWPLLLALHGGSSNGNLFLGVVLGNNMDWKTYDQHLWDRYEPRWSPKFIVAAPDGYGQVLWRWMGEQDVLDVVADIQRNYSVDDDRVVLSGLSNGGVGAYAIGSRHAWRFSVVQAIAGAPSWRDYAGAGSVTEPEATLMRGWNATDLADNWVNTDFRYYHGTVDPGPMKPAYVRALDATLTAREIPHTGKWFEAGHDLLYLVHRHGKTYGELEGVTRKRAPTEVRVVTGDYRAARQHWLEVTRFTRYPALAGVTARVDGARIVVRTENTSAFRIHVADLPLRGDEVVVEVDGKRAVEGARASFGAQLELVRSDGQGGWARGTPADAGLVKRAGLSGPLTDAYYDRMVHVYGTQHAAHTAQLKQLAERGARGYPLWLWTVEQEVVPDTAVTPELAQHAHLVLYGTPGDNLVLDRIAPKLPIRVVDGAVKLGARTVGDKTAGARFIYPNPEAPTRYVLVFSAPSVEGVRRGLNLPDFLPDYVIHDAKSAASRPRLVPGKSAPTRGFFGAHWELPGE